MSTKTPLIAVTHNRPVEQNIHFGSNIFSDLDRFFWRRTKGYHATQWSSQQKQQNKEKKEVHFLSNYLQGWPRRQSVPACTEMASILSPRNPASSTYIVHSMCYARDTNVLRSIGSSRTAVLESKEGVLFCNPFTLCLGRLTTCPARGAVASRGTARAASSTRGPWV